MTKSNLIAALAAKENPTDKQATEIINFYVLAGRFEFVAKAEKGGSDFWPKVEGGQ